MNKTPDKSANTSASNNKKGGALWLSTFFLVLLLVAFGLSAKIKPGWQEIKSSSLHVEAASLLQPQINDAQVQGVQIQNATASGQKDAINFLLLGAAGQGFDAPDLTDTIIVARLVPSQQKVFLFSLPRDLLVQSAPGGAWTKLNALYAINKGLSDHEFDLIINKVQEITGLSISHYVLVDLTTVKDLVDALGGVNVMVAKDIVDTTYPGPNHSYQTFEISAGWRFLDGETALKYIRSRHSTYGDFDRIGRQQEVLQAIKQKVLSLNLWDIPTFVNIFNAVSSRIKTDLSLWQMKSLWDDTKNIPGQNVITTDISTSDLVSTGQIELGGVAASVVQPRAGLENFDEIKNYISQIINN